MPDAVAPFAVAGNLPTSGHKTSSGIDPGPLVGLSLYMHQDRYDPSRQVEGSLMAIAALKDRVVIVYPSAAHDGLAIAWAGLDLPWQTQPLWTEWKRPDLGAVDAVAAPDGDGVLVAVRQRWLPTALVVLHWRVDGSIVRTDLARPSPWQPHWWQDRCPDLRLGVSPAGDVDLLFMHQGVSLMRATLRAGATSWESELVYESQEARVDVGCTSRLAYDEGGRPQVLLTRREWPVYASAPNFPDADQPPAPPDPGTLPFGAWGRDGTHTILSNRIGLVQDGVGRWRQDSTFAPLAYVWGTRFWQKYGFDLEEHPDGTIISGPEINVERQPHVKLYARGFRMPKGPRASLESTFPIDATPSSDGTELAQQGNLDKLFISECGDVFAYGTEPGLGGHVQVAWNAGALNGCLHEARAPVFRTTKYGSGQAAVFTHGRRPWSAGLCLLGDKPLVCVGGWAGLGDIEGNSWLPDRAPPELVSVSLANGAANVDVGTPAVTFTLSRPIEADETVGATISRVAEAKSTVSAMSVAGKDTVRVPLPVPLQAGTRYRVALGVSAPGGAHSWARGKAPVVTFTTAGEDRAPDRRETPETEDCPGLRTLLVCQLQDRPDFAVDATWVLPVDYDLVASGGRVPRVVDELGVAATGVGLEDLVDSFGRHTMKFRWRAGLTADTTYTVELHPDARNGWGAPFRPEDRAWRFRTRAP